MAKPAPEPIVSDSADETIALQMTRWLRIPATCGNASISCASILALG
jgi:hypothetical protein